MYDVHIILASNIKFAVELLHKFSIYDVSVKFVLSILHEYLLR